MTILQSIKLDLAPIKKKKETSHPPPHNGIVSTWSSPPYVSLIVSGNHHAHVRPPHSGPFYQYEKFMLSNYDDLSLHLIVLLKEFSSPMERDIGYTLYKR
ncbi:hypothetical protein BCON_0254g00160 [Botryotinia convoluta]|uniref:Uncharacterized protein n=1 Tax=Botryotinia convoluta TaxID=54673 RepID=A0A4Z1HGP1_9HELO|nr:hypothetical protein BCON_0254g00160 [Botryotinia convoluta]